MLKMTWNPKQLKGNDGVQKELERRIYDSGTEMTFKILGHVYIPRK
jgi:hypothetical protein